jgi:(S)-ureidoglycine aminohydrolase
VFEKPFQKAPGVELPEAVIGAAADLPAEPFMGDEDARLQVLLPADERFDLAVNLFTYQPGATLPQVEIHVMEHGLIMLDGAGVYRLGDSWYPVEAGDVIWMASYCPQWFVAMGKTPARYLYYKDVNRDPLAVSIS